MILEEFTIQGEERFKEFQQYLDSNMPAVQYEYRRSSRREKDKYTIAVHCTLDQVSTLNRLHDYWHQLDNKKSSKTKTSGIWHIMSAYKLFYT